MKLQTLIHWLKLFIWALSLLHFYATALVAFPLFFSCRSLKCRLTIMTKKRFLLLAFVLLILQQLNFPFLLPLINFSVTQNVPLLCFYYFTLISSVSHKSKVFWKLLHKVGEGKSFLESTWNFSEMLAISKITKNTQIKKFSTQKRRTNIHFQSEINEIR